MKALLLFLLVACSEDSNMLPDGGGATDAARADATPLDAAPLDAAPRDADAVDADSQDAEPSDAEPVDSGDAPDSGGDGGVQCSGLGMACPNGPECDPAYDCVMNVCIPPARPECGGFVGAQCPPAFPECLFYAGADVGPCFTAAERACICASPEGRAAFGCP